MMVKNVLLLLYMGFGLLKKKERDLKKVPLKKAIRFGFI